MIYRTQALFDDKASTIQEELARCLDKITVIVVIVVSVLFVCSISKKLKEIEIKHSISSRWTPSDREYKESEHALLSDKKEELLRVIWKAAKRRSFLLQLKAKYAGMSPSSIIFNILHYSKRRYL